MIILAVRVLGFKFPCLEPEQLQTSGSAAPVQPLARLQKLNNKCEWIPLNLLQEPSSSSSRKHVEFKQHIMYRPEEARFLAVRTFHVRQMQIRRLHVENWKLPFCCNYYYQSKISVVSAK